MKQQPNSQVSILKMDYYSSIQRSEQLMHWKINEINKNNNPKLKELNTKDEVIEDSVLEVL